jgi:hypothetical protein
MAGKGGARTGAGRKPKAEEDKVRNLAIDAIISKYGSEQKGFEALLASGESSLIKFAYEHAFGKPKEKIEHSGEMGISWNETKTYEAKRKTD